MKTEQVLPAKNHVKHMKYTAQTYTYNVAYGHVKYSQCSLCSGVHEGTQDLPPHLSWFSSLC